jgi:hypothetical protein
MIKSFQVENRLDSLMTHCLRMQWWRWFIWWFGWWRWREWVRERRKEGVFDLLWFDSWWEKMMIIPSLLRLWVVSSHLIVKFPDWRLFLLFSRSSLTLYGTVNIKTNKMFLNECLSCFSSSWSWCSSWMCLFLFDSLCLSILTPVLCFLNRVNTERQIDYLLSRRLRNMIWMIVGKAIFFLLLDLLS